MAPQFRNDCLNGISVTLVVHRAGMLLAANARDTYLSNVPLKPLPDAEVYAKDFALTQDYELDFRKFLVRTPL